MKYAIDVATTAAPNKTETIGKNFKPHCFSRDPLHILMTIPFMYILTTTKTYQVTSSIAIKDENNGINILNKIRMIPTDLLYCSRYGQKSQ